MDLTEAAAALAAGRVIAFPTDTVWGLAVRPGGEAAIYEIKGRPAELPLILMIASPQQAQEFVDVDRRARWYMERWWPGPLTLVLPAEKGTLGIRIPDHPLALALLRAAGPLMTTSANRHGEPPAASAAAAARLPGVAGALAGEAGGGEPSTVISLLPGQEMTVIREGAISSHLLGGDEHI